MKIDLYNNHPTFIKESKQDWTVSAWLKKRGITLDDLNDHEQITDVITLIRIREEIGHKFNQHEQGVWAAYWSWVYHRQFLLKAKHLKKLSHIAQAVIGIRNKKQKSNLRKIKLF